MTKNKNLFKNISLFFCLVPMLLLSLFCLIPNKDIHGVYAADNVLVPFAFNGSNINIVATSYDSDGSYDLTTINNVQISFSYSNNGFSARIRGYFLRSNFSGYRAFDESFDITSQWTDVELDLIGTDGFKLFCQVYCPNLAITKDINRVRLSTEFISVTSESYSSNIAYYDIHDNYITFNFSATTDIPSDSFLKEFLFDDRTYYINTLSSDNNVYYEEGYQAGYNAGMTDGTSIGYQDGYADGEIFGYGNGYNDGVEYGGNYSFLSLIGAVIDAPISAFTGLLNFNLLGFNMLGFVTGLLTLSLIIFIVKLILGGK